MATTRITFSDDFLLAIRIRGLTLGDVAARSGVSSVTVSSAVRGRPVNVRTALALSRAVGAVPVVAELERWTARASTTTSADHAVASENVE